MGLNVSGGGLEFSASLDIEDIVKQVDAINSQMRSVATATIEEFTKEQAAILETVKSYQSLINTPEEISKKLAEATTEALGSWTSQQDAVKDLSKTYDQSAQDLKDYFETLNAYNKVGVNVPINHAATPENPTAPPRSAPYKSSNEDVNALLHQGRTAFSGLDQESQDYIKTLIDLQLKLSNVAKAQKALDADYKQGKISAKQYKETSTALATSTKLITENIKGYQAAQAKYDKENASSIGYINQRKIALAKLKEEYELLTQAELNDSKVGGKLKESIADLNKEVKSLDLNSLGNSAGPEHLYTQLRKVKQELAGLVLSGADKTSAAFQNKLTEATELEHSLKAVNHELELSSSNVAGIEALQQGFKGLLGGTEAVLGVLGLFNTNQEEAEEITKNLTSVMGILNGVEEVGAILAKNSSLNIFLEQTMRKLATGAAEGQTAATVALTEAQGAEVVATEAATVAQVELNVAMEANPVGIILISIVALYAAYEILSKTIFRTSDAEQDRAKKLEILHDAESKAADAIGKEEASLISLLTVAKNDNFIKGERIGAIDELRKRYPEYLYNLSQENLYTEQMTNAIAREIDLIKARAVAKAAEDIYAEKLKKQIDTQIELNKQVEEGSGFFARLWAIVKTGNSGLDSYNVLKGKIKDVNEATDDANATFEIIADTQDQVAKALNSTTDQINIQAEGFEKLNNVAKTFNKNQQNVFDAKRYDTEKEQVLALANYKVSVAKKGTKEELDARRNLINAQFEQEKKDRRIFDESGSAYDPVAAQNTTAKFISDSNALNEEIINRGLKNTTESASALVLLLQAAGKQSAAAYFDAQAEAYRRAAREQIVLAKDNAGEIAQINAQLQLDLRTNDINRQKAALEGEISLQKAKATLANAGSKEENEARLKIIDLEAEAEILQAGKNTQKIVEIRTKADRDRAIQARAFEIEQSETTTNIKIAEIETELSLVESGTAKEFELKKSLIDQKLLLDIDSAKKQVKNEELLAAKIKEIQAKALLEQRKLKDQYVEEELQRQFAVIDRQLETKSSQAKAVQDDPHATTLQKDSAHLKELTLQYQELFAKVLFADRAIGQTSGKNNVLIEQRNALFTKMQAILNVINVQDKKVTEDKAAQLVAETKSVSVLFGSLASAAALFNSELARSLQLLAGIGENASKAIQGFKDYKTAKDSKDTAGQITAGADIATAVINEVKTVIANIDAAKKAKQSADQALLDFQDKLITGEAAYQALLRQRSREQILQNKLTIEGLTAQKQLLLQQKQANLEAYNDIFKKLQSESFTTGLSEKSKKNITGALQGIAGLFGSKTTSVKEITETLAGKSFDQLEELFNKGQLSANAKALFEQLQKIKQEGADIDAVLEENRQKAAEIFTGTTSEALLDSIVDGFKNGMHSAQDFAGNFEDLMRGAMINALKYQYLEGPLKDFFQQFADDSQSDNSLTQSEIDDLHNTFNSIISNADQQFQQLQQIAGINLSGSGTAVNSLQGAIKGMSEQTAELLAGQFGGLRMTAIDQLNICRQALVVQQQTQANTALTAERILDQTNKLYQWMMLTGIKIQ